MENSNIGKKIFGTIVLIVLFIFAVTLWPITSVKTNHRGVVIKANQVQTDSLVEGWHMISPIAEVVDMNVQNQKEEFDSSAASKDLQTVNAKIAVNYQLVPDKVSALYREVENDYSARLIAPAIQESIKAATARFTAEELVTKRDQVKEDIKNSLTQRLAGHFINVTDVSIINFDFSDSFNKAIEAKVTAEQDALAAKNKLEQVKFEANQRVAQAEAEAKAIQIQAQAITQQGGKEYVNLKAVEKWNGALPAQMIPNAALPFINLQK